MTLVDFLLARIAEDEARARRALGLLGYLTPWHREDSLRRNRGFTASDAAHVATWSPERILAECEAKRRIVQECEPFGRLSDPDVLMYLALPYADHLDYNESWRP